MHNSNRFLIVTKSLDWWKWTSLTICSIFFYETIGPLGNISSVGNEDLKNWKIDECNSIRKNSGVFE